MADSIPGFTAIKETEEVQLWASGPDNNHKRFEQKAHIDDTVVDSGNTPTTTIRGGRVMGLRDSDGKVYLYDGDATNGDQTVVGILPKHLSMLDKDGTVEDKFSKLLTAGILKNTADLLGSDNYALGALHSLGFTFAGLDPHGSMFRPPYWKSRYFKTADYTVVAADHGKAFYAAGAGAVNFTLPSLAAVTRGWNAFFYNTVAQNMVITGAADTIVYGDAAGGLSTTLTFSTANKQMGGQVWIVADFISDGGALRWFPYFLSTAVTSA